MALTAWLMLSLGVIVLDQGTKWLAVTHLTGQPPMVVVPGFFDLSLVHNSGAAFGLLNDAGGWQGGFFTTVAVIVSGFIIYTLAKLKPGDHQSGLAFALILGGAIGNVIDRVRQGYVVDFIHWFYQDWDWPWFNIADSAISVGAALLVLELIGVSLIGRKTL